jgi:hypothetical protein
VEKDDASCITVLRPFLTSQEVESGVWMLSTGGGASKKNEKERSDIG